MKIKNLTFHRIVLSVGTIVMGLLASSASKVYASDITFVSMVGNWRNPTYSASGGVTGINNGDPTSSINWGGTVAQSGYDFTKAMPGTLTLPPAPTPLFPLGSFTHRNQNLSVNPSFVSLRNAQLDVVLTLNVDGNLVGPLTFTFTFNHDETSNLSSMSQCDQNKVNPSSTFPCPDVVTIAASPNPTTFRVAGVDYTLSMSFVNSQSGAVSRFITEEQQTNVANLVGQFTLPPPPPSCGDNVCNGTDTCSNCAQDCGVCPVPPVITSFTANPTSINQGASSTLSWTITNATSAVINQGIGSINSTSGNRSVTPANTTTYTLTAWGLAGMATRQATVTVVPLPPQTARFDFSPVNYSAVEDAGFAYITVVRTLNTTGTSSVQFAATNGSASANQDYLSVSGTLTFAAGETSKTFDVPLIDDRVVESNETVNLTLSSPVNGTMGTSQAVLTITDNDTTNPPPPPPAPFISELIPYTVPVNFNLNFTMRVLGTGFNATSAQVIWNNGTTLPVVSRSTSEISVTMTPSLWNNTAGAYGVKVRNPGPVDSNEAIFTVRSGGSGNPPPWVVRQPTANPNPVVGGTSTQLSTLGGTFSSNGSESVLNYTWSANGPGTVTFSANGTNAAKNATATFSRAGTYTFQARIRDTVTGFAVDTNVLTVEVVAAISSLIISPRSVVLRPGQPYNFTVTVRDQFGVALSTAVTWSASAGTVASGAFTAPDRGGVTLTVTATAGGRSDNAQVTILVDGAGDPGDLNNVKVGPVPFKSTSGDPGVTFRGLPQETTIRIFTMNGRIVQTYTVAGGGDQLWDVRNANTDNVSSGVYFYRIESRGNHREGKLVIIK